VSSAPRATRRAEHGEAFDTGNPLSGAIGDASAGAQIGTLFSPWDADRRRRGRAVGAAAGLTGMAMRSTNLARGATREERSAHARSRHEQSQRRLSIRRRDWAHRLLAWRICRSTSARRGRVGECELHAEEPAVLQRIEDSAKGGHSTPHSPPRSPHRRHHQQLRRTRTAATKVSSRAKNETVITRRPRDAWGCIARDESRRLGQRHRLDVSRRLEAAEQLLGSPSAAATPTSISTLRHKTMDSC